MDFYVLEILWTSEISQKQKNVFSNEILLRMKILCAIARGKIKTWRNNNYKGDFLEIINYYFFHSIQF